MKEEALKLADLMIDVTDCETSEFYRAGQMIRRLVEELDKEKAKSGNLANSDFDTVFTKTALGESLTQTKPLSDDEIKELSELTSDPDPTDFVRAIEKRHGIK